MKNNILKYFILIYSLFFLVNSIAENTFTFESDVIEYRDNQNLIAAKGNVKITSLDKIEIYANSSEYYKDINKLFLKDNVIVVDTIRNITIESDQIEYQRDKEIIKTFESTKIKINGNYLIETDDLIYLRSEKILKSNKKTRLIDNFKNIIETTDFIYFVENKKFKSKNLKFLDKEMNEYSTNESFVDLSTNKIAGKDVKIYFSKNGSFGENTRLKGNYMISDEETTLINKGVFTTCRPNDKCPPWTMQSESISHNKKKKIIEYKNALLKLYDVPVLYFPKFFHPDPTVERQSGFLIPSITTSANSGNSIKIPYFFALAENKDFTLSPRIYFNNDILLQNEYRHLEKNSNHISDFSIKKLQDGTKSHFFSNSQINLNSSNFLNSNLEINLEKTSNDTYLKNEKLKNSIQNSQSLLNSYIRYEAFSDDIDLTLEIASFEDLTKEKNSDKYQFILPSFKISKIFSFDNLLRGNMKFSSSGVSQKRNTNITEHNLINDLNFKSDNFFTKKGFVNSFDILFKNISRESRNSDKYSDKFTNRNFMTANYLASLPLKKDGSNYYRNLSPKLSLKYSPFDNQNISNFDRKINSTNIFSNNRLGLTDSLEGGQSITMGFDYELFKNDNRKIFSSSLGQIFSDTNDSKLPKSSKMQNKSSDIVGNISYTPNNVLEFNYDFSADNNLDTMNYNYLETKLNINNFVTSFEFLEENNEIGSDSYFSKDIKYKFNQFNQIKYNTRRNRKTDLTEYYNLIYEYKNDCLVAAIEYNKNYYEDRDVKPNEEIFFKLTITPFTSINSPNLNK